MVVVVSNTFVQDSKLQEEKGKTLVWSFEPERERPGFLCANQNRRSQDWVCFQGELFVVTKPQNIHLKIVSNSWCFCAFR